MEIDDISFSLAILNIGIWVAFNAHYLRKDYKMAHELVSLRWYQVFALDTGSQGRETKKVSIWNVSLSWLQHDRRTTQFNGTQNRAP